jgi:glycosyltransferase 2 family protein
MMKFFSDKTRKLYSRILFFAVLAFVLYYILKSFSDIQDHIHQINYTSIVLSFVFTLAAYLLALFVWVRLVAAFGLKIDFLSEAKAWSVSQLGKYMPGKAGVLLVRLDANKNHPKKTIALATLVEFITGFIASCLLILISIFFLRDVIPYYFKIFALICSAILLILLHPGLLEPLTNAGLKFFNREPIRDFPSFSLILKFVFINILIGIPYGLGLYFSLNCFADINFTYIIPITGIYYLASLVGMAALFAPAGIGVREGLIFLVLPALIAKQVVIAGTIMIRIISLAVEISLALFFYFLHSKR